MMRSLFSAISGLQAHQTMVDITSHNIANVNTHGYKAERVTFAEQLSQTLFGGGRPTAELGGINPRQVGLGTRVNSIDTMLAQGSLEQTGNTLDMAISGDGFFVVSDGTKDYYTRTGAFSLDGDGYLTMQGQPYRIRGRLADEDGNITGSAASGMLQLPLSLKIPAKATSEIKFASNLDADATTSTATLGSAGTTGINQVSGTAADGSGGAHSITITGANATRDTIVSLITNTLTLNTRLGDVGGASNVTGVDFSIATDGGAAQAITGLSVNSTVGDLINAINAQVPGAVASLNGTQLQVERREYGNTATHNLQFADTTGGTPPNNLCSALYGATTRTGGGADSTLSAIDSFTPTGATTPAYTGRQLTFTRNANGLVTGIEGLGGGGVTISSATGIAAGTAAINTADTTHSTSIMVYDTLGVGHNLDVTFAKTGNANEWRWTASLPGESAATLSGNTGVITFNADGSLANFSYGDNATQLSIQLPNGANNLSISMNAGLSGSLSGITQTSSTFSTQAVSQNGYASGKLEGLSVDDSGTIFGAFTNGLNRALAQVNLATFANPQGLARVGGNMFETTVNSGDPRQSTAAGTSNRIYSGYLELSNVDLAKEFTSLIIGQRGYSANSRSVQTADQILMETLQIKR